jgi:hypothetical protein
MGDYHSATLWVRVLRRENAASHGPGYGPSLCMGLHGNDIVILSSDFEKAIPRKK